MSECLVDPIVTTLFLSRHNPNPFTSACISAQPGNRTCKTDDIRLNTLQTAKTGMANININRYHQLGLLTSLNNLLIF